MVACTTFTLIDGMLFLAVKGGLEGGPQVLSPGVVTVGICATDDASLACPSMTNNGTVNPMSDGRSKLAPVVLGSSHTLLEAIHWQDRAVCVQKSYKQVALHHETH